MKRFGQSLCTLIVVASLGWLSPGAYAQENAAPFLAVANVETSGFPTIELALYGDTLTSDLGELPVQVRVNDQEQPLLGDRTEEVGIQLATVIDPHAIFTAAASGQTPHAQVQAIILDLITKEVVVRNKDRLAAYTIAGDGELQTIQDWTGEPNLIYNSVVQNSPDEAVTNEALSNLLLQAISTFQEPASSHFARVLLLFSAGASQVDLENVITAANALDLHIHIVELAEPGQPPAGDDALQQLAQQTNGVLIRYATANDLQPLWRRLTALRTQRFLAYEATNTQPAAVRVVMTLPDGSPLEASLDLAPDDANALPATQNTPPVADVTPVVTPIATTAAPTPDPAATTPIATATTDPTTASETATTPPTAVPATESAPEVPASSIAAPAEPEADEVQPGGEFVVIPGTAIALPRSALQIALPVLLLLLAFFGYRELRERRARRTPASNPGRQGNLIDSRFFELKDEGDDLQPLAKQKAPARNADREDSTDFQVLEAPPRRAPVRVPQEEDDDDDEATFVPTTFSDDEATYRLSEEIEQPLLGIMVRVTNDPSLPQQLPVYGLTTGRGEERKIHIGRHSKNNTVVLNDKSISREHAIIVQREGRLYLRDNASTAGTFLNGRRLKPGEELLLRHNDLISFGEIVYEFRAKGEDEATVAHE